MPKIWPQDTIRELLALAYASGESMAELPTRRDAELFRFAIYSFRRNANYGEDLLITLEDNRVIVTKKPAPKINIIYGQEVRA